MLLVLNVTFSELKCIGTLNHILRYSWYIQALNLPFQPLCQVIFFVFHINLACYCSVYNLLPWYFTVYFFFFNIFRYYLFTCQIKRLIFNFAFPQSQTLIALLLTPEPLLGKNTFNHFPLRSRRYMTGILPIRHKTQSIWIWISTLVCSTHPDISGMPPFWTDMCMYLLPQKALC